MHLVRPISQISRWLLSFLSRCRWSDPSPWRATLCRQTKNKEGAINKDAAILQQEAFVSLQDYKLQVAPECSAFKYGVYTLAFCLHLSAPTTTRVFVGHVRVCVCGCVLFQSDLVKLSCPPPILMQSLLVCVACFSLKYPATGSTCVWRWMISEVKRSYCTLAAVDFKRRRFAFVRKKKKKVSYITYH